MSHSAIQGTQNQPLHHSPALETFTLTLGKTMGGEGLPLLEAAEDLVARTMVVDLRRLWGVHSWRRKGRKEGKTITV